MSTAVWSYVPTESVTEDIESAARGLQWLGKPAVYTAIASHQIRKFTLSWGPAVDSTEVNSMLAFYRARLGSFDSFVWRSPIDARTYCVRFDTTIKADNFQPGWWRSGAQLAFVTTNTPTVTTVVGTPFNYPLPPPPDPSLPGSGGIHPDAGSGDGVGPGAFWFPDAWYVAGWNLADLTTYGGNQTFTSNLIGAQPFANATSGVALDALGVVVLSGLAGQYVNFALYMASGENGAGAFDSYPSSRVAVTSCQVNNAGLAVASITKVHLQDTVYWVTYVTSFNSPAAQFMQLAFFDGAITGQSSGSGGQNNPGPLIYTHSMSLPATFPSSATEHSGQGLRVVFHIASEAP